MLHSRTLLVIHFKYSSVYLSIPDSLTIPCPQRPPSNREFLLYAWLDGLGAGSLSTLLHCTSSGGEGGLETLALTGEEKDEACTSHRINTRNSGGEAAGASVSNVEPRTSVCT